MFFNKSKHARVITGLDIGTTKICAIIGQATPDGKLSILGIGTCPSKGLRCGEVTEIEPTIEAISIATQRASEQAGVPVSEVYVGIAGEHIHSLNCEADIEIRHATRGIDEGDRQRVIDKALAATLPEDQALLLHVVQEFQVNGRQRTTNPIGLAGTSLRVQVHLVTCSLDSLQNILRCVDRAHIRRPHIVLQSLASSMSVINSHETELGVVLVDIGGGTTDIAISIGGAVRATGEIALGGDHITRDIAQVLQCRLSDAENTKKRHGVALPEMVQRGRTFQLAAVGDPSEMLSHEEYKLAEIIEMRLEDIFERVRDFIRASGCANNLHAGVVLTGGTAMLQGIADVAGRMLDMKCRVGTPRGLAGVGHVANSPIYATGVGLILYAQHDAERLPRRRGFRRILNYVDSLAG